MKRTEGAFYMGNYEAQDLWEQVRGDLARRKETNSIIAQAFFEYLEPQDLTETTFVVKTSLVAAKQQIESRYLPFIDDAITQVLGSTRQVTIVVSDDVATLPNSLNVPSPASLRGQAAASTQTTSPQVAPLSTPQEQVQAVVEPLFSQPTVSAGSLGTLSQNNSPTGVTPVYQQEHNKKTFETYVVGASNDFAKSAAQGVAETPGLRFNPLFIYGRSGLGKTHLLLAIKDYINRYHPERKVVFAQTSEFVNDFTSAMASINKDLTDFRIKYYMCEVLLLDDVQYLEGKESTTNALFDIFNVFISQNKQIVLSADRAPNEINLDNRFTSRFASGVTAGIQPPDFEMKMAIFNNLIKYYCYQFHIDNISISQEVADHIIGLSSSNIRELEGATSSLVSFISQKDNYHSSDHITIEEAEQIVGKVFLQNDMKEVDVRVIQKEVEVYFNISHTDMVGPCRSKNISYPRHVAMYLSRRLTSKSYPEIARLFGGKDHTSVLYACQKIEEKTTKDRNKKKEIEHLAQLIMS
jgi:chromosomal replication initiator protein